MDTPKRPVGTSVSVLSVPITGNLNGKRVRHIKCYAIVRDDEFGRSIAASVWSLDGNGYPYRTTPRKERHKHPCRHIWIHKEVYRQYHGELPSGMVIDHINQDKLDSRAENLRMATRSVNGANSVKRKNNSSGYTGVTWNKRHRKWQSQLMLNRKHIHLGLYANSADAAKAVNDGYAIHFPGVRPPNTIPDSQESGSQKRG